MAEPKVSVIIPVRNRVVELERALKSVLNQTLNDFEVIVVDDYSKEDISRVVSDLHDSRLHYVKSDGPSGNANVCRNIGFGRAQGAFFAMLDSDDEWLPHHLEDSISFIEANQVDGVFSSAWIDNGESKKVKYARPLKNGERMADYLLTDGFAPTPSHVYRAEAITSKELSWDNELKRHQDFDFSIRFAANNNFVSKQEPTVVVHWAKGERRTEDFDSQLKFIQKHTNAISKKVYCSYFASFSSVVIGRKDVSRDIKQKVRKELLRYPSYLSLVDYLTAYNGGNNAMHRIFLRFRFVLIVLFKNA